MWELSVGYEGGGEKGGREGEEKKKIEIEKRIEEKGPERWRNESQGKGGKRGTCPRPILETKTNVNSHRREGRV